jgi:hypothetical protein
MQPASRHPGQRPSCARRSSLASSQSQWGAISTHPRHEQVVGVRGRLHQGQSGGVAMGGDGYHGANGGGRIGRGRPVRAG